MPELRFKRPCNDCPFRRASLAGWTGGAPPEWFVESALADYASYDFNNANNSAPCHQTIDYSDPDWLQTQAPEAAACAGALIFAKNNFKMPRDPARSKLVRQVEMDTETIFATAEEFIEHHRKKDGMRSWER